MGIERPPAYTKIVRWRKAIPQYVVGHEARLRQIEGRVAALGGLFLGGHAYYGIGINDCTAHAAILAPRVVEFLASPPAEGNR